MSGEVRGSFWSHSQYKYLYIFLLGQFRLKTNRGGLLILLDSMREEFGVFHIRHFSVQMVARELFDHPVLGIVITLGCLCHPLFQHFRVTNFWNFTRVGLVSGHKVGENLGLLSLHQFFLMCSIQPAPTPFTHSFRDILFPVS